MARRSTSSKSPSKDRAKFLKSAKGLLLARRAELTNNITSELRDMRESDRHESSLSDMEDVGGQAVDEETAYKVLEIGSSELEEIDYALDRLEGGSYGSCDECEKPINIKRLQALPFASMCIDCKRKDELTSGDELY